MPDELDFTTPDFSNSVDVIETDSGQAVTAVSTPDFSNSSDVLGEQVRNKKTNPMKEITRPFIVQYQKSAEAFNLGMAGFSQRLSNMVKYVSDKTGMEEGHLFDLSAKEYMLNAEYWNKKAELIGQIVEVQFQEWTGDKNSIRFPVFSRFRPDKNK